MSFQDFFTPPGIAPETSFFDEGPRIVPKLRVDLTLPINSSTMGTADIDGYRQGVEITQLKYFDAGLAKIHAGEPGHVLRRNRFGMDRNLRPEPAFQEIDYFNPVTFLRAQELNDTTAANSITFPIITGDNDQIENYIFDGVIEPLPIREIASFFSIDVPFHAHDVRATLMGGTEDSTHAAARVLTVDYFEPNQEQIPYLDLVDLIGPSGSVPQPLNGFFEFRKSTFDPFNDARLIRNIPTSDTYDDSMISALSPMTGSTDNYISYKQKSGAAGAYYDNTPAGTDSIAFGGMTY